MRNAYTVTYNDLIASNATTSATTNHFVWATPTATITPSTGVTWLDNFSIHNPEIPDRLPASKRTLELPDGAKLQIDDHGNYKIEDKDAKVTYRANRIREFSPHLNASDLLAQFVEYVGKLGVRQKEVLGLPLELFVNWLIIEAAERDQDPVPTGVVRVEKHKAIVEARRPKCVACGRFIPRLYHQNRFPFCGPEHGVRYSQKLLARPAS